MKKNIILQCVFIFAFCLLFGFVIFTVVKPALTDTQEYKVSGSSMYLPLEDGDVVEVDLAYTELNRFDVIVFRQLYEGKPTTMIKRVIGLPTEQVEYTNGNLAINGVHMEEPYAEGFSYLTQDIKGTSVDNCYYVMGDNRRHSTDSRVFGCVPQENIIGVVKDMEIVE